MINEKPAGFLTKAERSLEATGLLLNAGHADFAVSRLYYAFYYTATGLLADRGLEFTRHHAMIGQFGVVFARDPALRFRPYHRLLHQLLDFRHTADDTLHPPMAPDHLATLLIEGREFLAAARFYPASQPIP